MQPALETRRKTTVLLVIGVPLWSGGHLFSSVDVEPRGDASPAEIRRTPEALLRRAVEPSTREGR